MPTPTLTVDDLSDQQALLAMFRRIPIDDLEITAHRLLNAYRTVRTSKAMKIGDDGVERPDTVQEPDFAVQLKTWQTIIEQRAGAAGTRKPTEPEPPKEPGKSRPGILRQPKPKAPVNG